jgi:creatinine amidohydrolase
MTSMPSIPNILADAVYRDIRNERYEVAVLGWAATEPHGLHLPYGTDIVECDRIGGEATRRANLRGARTILLPTVPYGVNTGQMDLPMTMNMNPTTQMALLDDIAASLDAHGVPKLVVLNGHGGNDFRQMIRELQPGRKVFLCSAHWYRAVEKGRFFAAEGDHADEMETSLMLHFSPERVLPVKAMGDGAAKRSRVRAFREGWAWAPRRWSAVTRDTGVGDPRAATPEKGERYFDAVCAALADFFVELAAADPGDLYV